MSSEVLTSQVMGQTTEVKRGNMHLSRTCQHRIVRESVRISLLYLAGMTATEIARTYGISRTLVFNRLRRNYDLLGITDRAACRAKMQLLSHMVDAGYLDCLYVLMCLIQDSKQDVAVALVNEVEV